AQQFFASEQRQRDVDRRAELHAKAAGRARRAAAAGTVRAIEHDDVANAARREVIRDARADHARADDDDAHQRIPVSIAMLTAVVRFFSIVTTFGTSAERSSPTFFTSTRYLPACSEIRYAPCVSISTVKGSREPASL